MSRFLNFKTFWFFFTWGSRCTWRSRSEWINLLGEIIKKCSRTLHKSNVVSLLWPLNSLSVSGMGMREFKFLKIQVYLLSAGQVKSCCCGACAFVCVAVKAGQVVLFAQVALTPRNRALSTVGANGPSYHCRWGGLVITLAVSQTRTHKDIYPHKHTVLRVSRVILARNQSYAASSYPTHKHNTYNKQLHTHTCFTTIWCAFMLGLDSSWRRFVGYSG